MIKAVHTTLKIFAWLSIVASPVAFGAMAGGVIYLAMKDLAGIILASLVIAASLVLGIIIATRIWRKRGTIEFISRISATPELDDLDQPSSKEQR